MDQQLRVLRRDLCSAVLGVQADFAHGICNLRIDSAPAGSWDFRIHCSNHPFAAPFGDDPTSQFPARYLLRKAITGIGQGLLRPKNGNAAIEFGHVERRHAA